MTDFINILFQIANSLVYLNLKENLPQPGPILTNGAAQNYSMHTFYQREKCDMSAWRLLLCMGLWSRFYKTVKKNTTSDETFYT